MKPRLSPAQQQHLILTPQLRQAIRLLQLSGAELEAEIAEAVASNPLLDWTEEAPGEAALSVEVEPERPREAPEPEALAAEAPWERDAEPWQVRGSDGGGCACGHESPDKLGFIVRAHR